MLTTDIQTMVGHLGESPIDVQDRALVLVGLAGPLRRSELVALDVDDVAFTDDGLVVAIRRSKTGQEGEGATVGIHYGSDPATCPVPALRTHLELSGIADGPIFRTERDGHRMSGRAAAARVQHLAGLIGRDVDEIGAHSLRAGLITAAWKAGQHEHRIMAHTRHKSLPVFRSYVRGLDVWDQNPAAGVGL